VGFRRHVVPNREWVRGPCQASSLSLLHCHAICKRSTVQLYHVCRENIFKFMHQKLGVPQDQCKATWRPLFAKTNQSLKVMYRGFSLFRIIFLDRVNLLAPYRYVPWERLLQEGLLVPTAAMHTSIQNIADTLLLHCLSSQSSSMAPKHMYHLKMPPLVYMQACPSTSTG